MQNTHRLCFKYCVYSTFRLQQLEGRPCSLVWIVHDIFKKMMKGQKYHL